MFKIKTTNCTLTFHFTFVKVKIKYKKSRVRRANPFFFVLLFIANRNHKRRLSVFINTSYLFMNRIHDSHQMIHDFMTQASTSPIENRNHKWLVPKFMNNAYLFMNLIHGSSKYGSWCFEFKWHFWSPKSVNVTYSWRCCKIMLEFMAFRHGVFS